MGVAVLLQWQSWLDLQHALRASGRATQLQGVLPNCQRFERRMRQVWGFRASDFYQGGENKPR